MKENSIALGSVTPFLRQAKWRVLILSAVLITPCLWHHHIEAGDLASHTYNAWLAELAGRGQAPGLYMVRQWNNVLFDVSLSELGRWISLTTAEKIIVSSGVLIFFWGVFALASAVAQRATWNLTPCIAILVYGYTFQMGFINYYLSIGLGCFCLALAAKGKGVDWLVAAVLLPLALLGHPIGFLWALGTIGYVALWKKLAPKWRLLIPVAAVGCLYFIGWYLAHDAKFEADWPEMAFYKFNGADQLILFGNRYWILYWAALAWGVICFASETFRRRREIEFWKSLRLILELYLVAFCATSLLPENFHVSWYAGWIGLLVSRLTTISAVLGLCAIGLSRPRKWQMAGFVVCTVFFFVFLYQDTGDLDRMESRAEQLLTGLPPRTRVIGIIDATEGSRLEFVHHIVDRACIGRCFSYANYEPSSGQFRIRVREGSPVVTSSNDDSEAMQGGTYVVRKADLPLKVIFQCDDDDPTKLCLRDLREGEKTGQPEVSTEP
jgi:hypothetical protein